MAADVSGTSSAFERALEDYIRSRPKKSKTPQFIKELKAAREPCTKQDVHAAIQKLERDNANTTATRVVRTTLKPIIRVLTDYASVIESLAQADPTPVSIVWGTLKVVVNASTRFLDLYERISDQLDAVETHLSRLTEFEELFGESKNMQAILEKSYVHVIRFWRRVEKECNRCVTNRLLRSFASFSTSKLDGIVLQIETSAKQISALVPVVQARIDRGERENAAEERLKAGLARDQAAAMFDQLLEDRKGHRLQHVRNWLQPDGTSPSQSSVRHHQENISQYSQDTCSWLSGHEKFISWTRAEKQPDSALWVSAAPGMGKSITCAFAIDHLAALNPEAACLYHYYSFDEEFQSLQVFQSFAMQLVDALWKNTQDMPEEIYNHTLQSHLCVKIDDAKSFIQMVLERLPATYVFLDGLDEECEDPLRWAALTCVLDFLIELSAQDKLNFRLWCSCQDRAVLRSKLSTFSYLEIVEDLNVKDIALCLSRRILQLDSRDFGDSYKSTLLQGLIKRAHGCFLWASLMLESIADASTLSQVQSQIQGELPELYEDYYARKLNRLKPSDKQFASVLLSCVLFAKRPLRLNELSEATAAAKIEDGDRIDKSQQLFRSKILKLCEPLVRVSRSKQAADSESLCVLSHSSVRNFLLKRPDILRVAEPSNRVEICISEDILANVCLKYLWQPAYRELFRKENGQFRDINNVPINAQYLLPYAAKYWDKHLDKVIEHQGTMGCKNEVSYCNRVQRFIHSPQFYTCLQAQSLLVQGQFQFWYAWRMGWMGPQIKRAFPNWLAERCLPTLGHDYAFFVGEWGHLLSRITSLRGSYQGEIDRCFWEALGPWHFLRHGNCRYRNFMLSEDHTPIHDDYLRYYDGWNIKGDEAVLLKLEGSSSEQKVFQFQCQRWKLEGQKPECIASQTLMINRENWDLYELPVSSLPFGRTSAVMFTNDLRCFRIGAEVFIRDDEALYQRFELEESDSYIEDIAIHNNYLAVARRNKITQKDLRPVEVEVSGNDSRDLAEYAARKLGLRMNTVQTSELPDILDFEQDEGEEEFPTSDDSSSIDADNASPGPEPAFSLAAVEKAFEDGVSDSVNDSDDNSALTSWTDGSTRAKSELDAADDWNDWARDAELEDLKDDASETSHPNAETDIRDDMPDDVSSDSESLKIEDPDEVQEDSDSEMDIKEKEDDEDDKSISVKSHVSSESKNSDGSASEVSSDDGSRSEGSSVESHCSESYGDDDSDDDEDDGESDEEDLFGTAINAAGDTVKGSQRIVLKIYDTTLKNKKPIFSFSHRTKPANAIYRSPPAFHPTKPLLAWPLGGNEILFADYKANSYFKRLLSRTRFHSCHVFTQVHFSSDGSHVHFAALEASRSEDLDTDNDSVLLNLQITTHKLSASKTTRVPPRLCFCVNVPIGAASNLSVSDLPYHLEWRPNEVYITIRDITLNVIRAPLFPAKPGEDSAVPCYVQKRVFLPRSALYRQVRYIPPRTADDGLFAQGLVILGSHCTSVARNSLVPRVGVSPPIGVFLDEEQDLGGWRSKLSFGLDDNESKLNRRAAGRLRDMYETFDLRDDCDIVPYLR